MIEVKGDTPQEVCILDHFKTTVEADAAHIQKHILDFKAAARELPHTTSQLQQMDVWGCYGQEPELLSFTHSPLLSHTLMKAAFYDLRVLTHERKPINKSTKEFIGGTLLTHTGVVAGEPLFTTRIGRRTRGICPNVEFFFDKLLDQLAPSAKADVPVHGRVSVYGVDGKPLLLRKQERDDTALVLENGNVGGVNLAPGTLIAPGDSPKFKPVHSYKLKNTQIDIYEFQDDAVTEIDFSPLRQTAWVYSEPRDRALFAVSLYQATKQFMVDQARLKYVTGRELGDFQTLAQDLWKAA